MSRLPASIEDALHLVSSRFPKDAIWTVSCGTALALHGLDYRPNDLDIFAGRNDGARLAQTLADQPLLFPYRLRESDWCSSHWGRFMVEGVEVDVVGDFSIRRNGNALTLDAAHPCWRRLHQTVLRGAPITALSLVDLSALYEALPDEEMKLRLIEESLQYGLHRP